MANTNYQFSHSAMTTMFEIMFAVPEESDEAKEYARQTAQAAFSEIDRVEKCLSKFDELSDISRLNALGTEQPVKVSPEAFDCLDAAQRMYKDTGGAFDVTAKRGSAAVGADALVFDRTAMTVQFSKKCSVDLGGIGKGFALDVAAEMIADWADEATGIGPAFMHGGTSSVLAVGAPPGEKGWVVTVGSGAIKDGGARKIAIKDRALSSSGIAARGEHVIDPSTGKPAATRFRVWASVGVKTEFPGAIADALSTAFMIMPVADIEKLCKEHPDTWGMVLEDTEKGPKLLKFGNVPAGT